MICGTWFLSITETEKESEGERAGTVVSEGKCAKLQIYGSPGVAVLRLQRHRRRANVSTGRHSQTHTGAFSA